MKPQDLKPGVFCTPHGATWDRPGNAYVVECAAVWPRDQVEASISVEAERIALRGQRGAGLHSHRHSRESCEPSNYASFCNKTPEGLSHGIKRRRDSVTCLLPIACSFSAHNTRQNATKTLFFGNSRHHFITYHFIFDSSQRAGSPINPGNYQGIRLIQVPGDIELSQSHPAFYPVSEIVDGDYPVAHQRLSKAQPLSTVPAYSTRSPGFIAHLSDGCGSLRNHYYGNGSLRAVATVQFGPGLLRSNSKGGWTMNLRRAFLFVTGLVLMLVQAAVPAAGRRRL